MTSVALGEADLASDLGTNDPIVLDWLRGGVDRLASGEMVDPAMRGRAEAILSLGRRS